MDRPGFVPVSLERLSPSESLARARAFRDLIVRRRSVRDFAPDDVAPELLDAAIEAASTAPSGANRQPWRFVVVRDATTKQRIRDAAEAEEREFYERRATREWLADLAPLGTDWRKPFLTTAAALIVVFALDGEPDESGVRHKNYYVQESVGIAVGFLLAALHSAGLATLTHTPSPMGFLGRLLGRPRHERAYVLIPVGHPAADAQVPDIRRKPLHDVLEVV